MVMMMIRKGFYQEIFLVQFLLVNYLTVLTFCAHVGVTRHRSESPFVCGRGRNIQVGYRCDGEDIKTNNQVYRPTQQ